MKAVVKYFNLQWSRLLMPASSLPLAKIWLCVAASVADVDTETLDMVDMFLHARLHVGRQETRSTARA